MAKGYWISCYRKIKSPEKLAAYAKLAAPAIQAAGGKFIVRGPTAVAHEHGIKERTVVVEFESLAKANEVHDGPAYQAALKELADGAERDFRICEGV